MRLGIGSALVSLVIALSLTTGALAQSDDTAPASGDAASVDVVSAPAPISDQPSVVDDAVVGQPVVAPELFLTLGNPSEQDVEVPLETVQLTIQGSTIPGAVVSIDGELADTDAQGGFSGVSALSEGANEIVIVASDSDGNQVSTNLFVTRG